MRSKRFGTLFGILGILAVFVLGWGLWNLLFAPNGVMKFYTPMYGFALLAVYFGVLTVMTEVFTVGDNPDPVRGAIPLAVSVALLVVVFYGFFWNFLGRFGVTYFSPQAIIAAGGTGAEFFNARENSSLAIIYLVAAFIWVTAAWRLALGDRPWQGCNPAAAGLARFFGISLLAGLAYLIFFHPHVTSLFYPAQTFAGVPPWWEERAMTGSAYFNLGWIFASLFIILLLETAWEVQPGIRKQGGILLPLAVLGAAIGGGFLLFWGMETVMDRFWSEPFVGGSYTDAPYFRHLHVAEISGFLILGLLIWRVFLGNWPTSMSRLARGLVRTAAVSLLALAIWGFYYAEGLGPALLDRVPGFAQPDDTPLAWTLLMLSLILVYERFFGTWPLRRARA